MAIITNLGLTLLATALQTDGVSAAIDWVDACPGCGTLASALVNGTPYSSLALDVALPANVSAGATVVITDGTNTDTATVSGAGATAGALSIPLTGYTASHNFLAHTTGVTLAQSTSDTSLYNGSAAVRIAATPGVAGANPGESLNNGYFDSTQATAVYMQVGYFGGSTASSTPGTGILMAEDIQFWNHTQNADSASFQLDSTL